MLDSLYQSLVIFFVAKAAYWDTDVGIWEFGTTITTSCLVTMLLHCAIEIKSWVSPLYNLLMRSNSIFVFSDPFTRPINFNEFRCLLQFLIHL